MPSSKMPIEPPQDTDSAEAKNDLMIDLRFREEIFQHLYKTTMRLIEETANYIDENSKSYTQTLPPHIAQLYSNQTMRLSSRLMQLGAWFLLERAAKDQDITSEQQTTEQKKIQLRTPELQFESPHWNDLPEEFLTLVQATLALEDRILGWQNSPATQNHNPLTEHWKRLEEAFKKR